MRIQNFVPAVVVVALAGSAFGGASVYINDTANTITTITNDAFTGNYRISANNFDQRVSNGQGEAVGANTLTRGLGNVSFLSGRTYAFSFEHRAAQGFIFTMTDQSQGGITSVLAWGDNFVPALPVNNPPSTLVSSAATLNGVAPGAAYNGINISFRGSDAGSSAVFSDLAFSAPSAAIFGSLITAGNANPGTGSPLGFINQSIATDGNFALIDWTVSGVVTLTRAGGGDGEGVRMRIDAKNGTFVPAPGAAGGLALAGLVIARRRR